MAIITVLIIGCAVGFLSTFLGIGGGAIIVPSLYLCFAKIPATTVISTSLSLIFLNSVINTIKFARKGQKIDYKYSMQIGVFCIIGAITGSYFIQIIPGTIIKKIFGIMLLSIAARLKFQKIDSNDESENINKNLKAIISSGVVGGFISSVTGLGGGAIFIPMFITILKIPIKLVSVYSNFCMVFATLFGVIPHLFNTAATDWSQNTLLTQYNIGTVSIPILAILFIGSNLSNGVGIKYNQTVDAKKKRNIFITLLLVLGIKILI